MRRIYSYCIGVSLLGMSAIVIADSRAASSTTSYAATPSRFLTRANLDLGFQSQVTHLLNGLCNGATRSGCSGNSVAHGQSGSIDDLAAKLPANLRVTFLLTEITHEVVSGGGVQDLSYATFKISGPAPTMEIADLSVEAPAPGMTSEPGYLPVYDGLLLDGCGTTQSFPIDFSSSIYAIPEEGIPGDIGIFSRNNDDTIEPNGYWTFDYTIHATSNAGGVSNYRFRGLVSATCTNATSL